MLGHWQYISELTNYSSTHCPLIVRLTATRTSFGEESILQPIKSLQRMKKNNVGSIFPICIRLYRECYRLRFELGTDTLKKAGGGDYSRLLSLTSYIIN